MEKIFGIDLGTTNSEIAYLEKGKPVVVELEEGKYFIPSVVGLDRKGNIITGFEARNQYAAFPEDTVVSIKRMMGSGGTVSMGAKEYTPAEVSSFILKSLKEKAEKSTGFKVEKVVITVPAYFSDVQRSDTIKAGELAGLDVVRIINEPTAAALAYSSADNSSEKVLVYDLGGGTFDISLMEIEKGLIEVMATDGDCYLGGDDFDRALRDFLRSFLPGGDFQKEDLKRDARLKNISEAVKIDLSTQSLVRVEESFLGAYKGKPVNLEIDVSRIDFEKQIEDELERSFRLLDSVINTAELESSDIDRLILAGGSTRIPKIMDVLREDYGFNVHREIDPYFCVVMGAAVQGGIISGEELDRILVDVNSHSLGICCLGVSPTGELNPDLYSVLIPRNTSIPSSMTKTYYTSYENQKAVTIDIYQGEDRSVDRNTFIASFVLDQLPGKLPAGSEVDITFEYNINGLVEVSALDRGSGKIEKLEVDINRITGEGKEGKPNKAVIDKRKIKRVIKTAGKKIGKLNDSRLELKLEILDTIKKLEDVMDLDDTAGCEKLLADLADLLSGIK